MGLWSALTDGIITAEQARDFVIASCERKMEDATRWIDHLTNRLAYERAMLAESEWTPPPKPKSKSDLPLLNYSGEVSYRNPYRNEVVTSEAVGITKAELAAIHSDCKGTRVSADGTHRVRTAMHVRGCRDRVIVYLTDSKQHPRPGAAEVEHAAADAKAAENARMRHELAKDEARATARAKTAPARAAREAAAAPFRAIEDSLRTGVQVVSAPQLFPSPAPLAARMVEAADIQPGMRVLEPSAGTGAILRAIAGQASQVVAVELSRPLADAVPRNLADAVCGDFLALQVEDLGGPFDRVVMNPPFAHGADIRHIKHALAFLRPGGRLVAICADGPRQRAELKPLVIARGGTWEELPEGSFTSSGTCVRTVLMTVDAEPATTQQVA